MSGGRFALRAPGWAGNNGRHVPQGHL